MINLIPIYDIEHRFDILYRLLKERTPKQSISHKKMPSLREHVNFINSNPYLAWHFICTEDGIAGSIYLTKQREIGISVFRDYLRRGYGKQAVIMLMRDHPGTFLANINPENSASIEFFKDLGAKHIQNTYKL